MTDFLYISYDKDEKTNASGICIGRMSKKGITTILKMCLDEEADILYKLLTDQTLKVNKLNVKDE